MGKSLNISVLVALLIASQTTYADDDDYKFYVKAGGSLLTLSGDISEEKSAGGFSPEVDLDDDLGLESF